MSARNGDRARFQKNRKRKLLLRQRIRQMLQNLRNQPQGFADHPGENGPANLNRRRGALRAQVSEAATETPDVLLSAVL
jgi:hypothetical protein